MNYYERHLGDYAKDTGHLTMVEHGAYTLLLDRYYSTEAPIPCEQAHRVARARSKEERDAVDVVLQEFFLLTDAGWAHNRVTEEIEKARVRIEAAKENGKRGGRPRKNPVGSGNETQQKPDGFSLGSISETQSKAHQTPDTSKSINPPDGGFVAGKPATANCPHAEIVGLYHEILPELRRVKDWTEDRQGFLRARWREKPERQSLDWWRKFFEYVRGCPWLMGQEQGRDGRAFDCDLEWLIRPTNFRKVVEGKYQPRAA